ncbi:MAG: hypothetical protein C4538_07365 [Nitrospiraceae bacterium]|nr:MAG: hypothetical protein C4538_07365 [Nitrospiraceae bacterium]
MSIKINQEFKYQGNDWWKWWIWVDGSDDELDQIDRVTYYLHPTFPDPVRTITDRKTMFRLETAGWGVFRIRAKAVKKNGEEIQLSHNLVLEYPDGRRTTA